MAAKKSGKSTTGHKRRTPAEIDRLAQDLKRYFEENRSDGFAGAARHFFISAFYAGLLLTRVGCKTPYPRRGKRTPRVGTYTGVTEEQFLLKCDELGGVVTKAVEAVKKKGLKISGRWADEIVLRARGRRQSYPEVGWEEAIADYPKLSMDAIAKKQKTTYKRIRSGFIERDVPIQKNTAHLENTWRDRKRLVEIGKPVKKVIETVSDEAKQRKAILLYLAVYPEASPSELKKIFAASPKTIQRARREAESLSSAIVFSKKA